MKKKKGRLIMTTLRDIFTARIRMMGKVMLHRCLSVHRWVGYPSTRFFPRSVIPFPFLGYPSPRFFPWPLVPGPLPRAGQWGVPQSWKGGTAVWPRGYPSPGWGYPRTVAPPARIGLGYSPGLGLGYWIAFYNSNNLFFSWFYIFHITVK